MKKILLLLSVACFILPAEIHAQYSNATLTGPWITFNSSNNGGVNYIIFDGAGNITQLGSKNDTLSPVGTYSVTAPGAISATLNLTQGTTTVTGQLLNDSSANLTVTGLGSIYADKVLNTGALAGTWSGVIFDTSANYSKNVTLTVSNTGVVTAATGVTGLIAGHIFISRDTFAGYITTMDDSCPFQSIQLAGIQYMDSLLGEGQLGAASTNCGSFALAEFVQTSNGIATIPAIDFSVYPNPFSEQIEISVKNPADKMQADLYDLYGRKVLSQPLATVKNTSLDAGTLSSGMYMLTLTNADGQSTTQRVVKN